MTGVATLLRYIAIAMVVAALSVSASAQIGYAAVRDFLRGHVTQAQQVDQQQPAQPPERLPGESKAKISKADAKDLFRSVDEIARWVSDETGLKVEHEIKRQLSSRADLQTYLEEKMRTDEGSERLKRAEVVLKKFGMLPPDFDMAPFLLRLLREQIVGFYDPGKKTIYLLDWVDLRDQKPVLAHELTHALQDQAVGLEKWLRAAQPQKHETQNSADRNLAEAASDIKPQKKRGKEELTFDPDQDERQAARDAVAEGQGMVAMLDYELQSSNRTALNSPQMIQDTFDRMVTARDSPIFTSLAR